MAFAPILAAASLGITAAGGIMGGIASRQQAQYQAGVAELNRKISLQNAQYERQMGEVQAQRVGMQYGQEIGRTRAIQGASNLDVARGSAVSIQDSEHQLALQDLATTRANAARRAFGYETGAAQYGAQEGMYRAAASYAIPASIIGTAASVSSKWLQASMMGALPGGSALGPSTLYGTDKGFI